MRYFSYGLIYFALLLPVQLAAEHYRLVDGGAAIIESSLVEQQLALIAASSGFEGGGLELDIDAVSGRVALSGGEFQLADFIVNLGSGMRSAEFAAVDTRMRIRRGLIGQIEGWQRVVMVSSTAVGDGSEGLHAGPALETESFFHRCRGALCFYAAGLDLNIQQFSLELDFSEDFSLLDGRLLGYTANGSTLTMAFHAMRVGG